MRTSNEETKNMGNEARRCGSFPGAVGAGWRKFDLPICSHEFSQTLLVFLNGHSQEKVSSGLIPLRINFPVPSR